MAEKKDKLAKIEEMNFLPVVKGIEVVKDLVVANMGGDDIGAFDLDRAINPAGKGTSFAVPGLDGEDEMEKALTGIIIHHQSVRAYWEGDYDGGSPPDCASTDTLVGVGEPGGKCKECPFSVFGSGQNNSQACRKVKRIFLLREGELLPTLVTMSPVNYGKAKSYFLRLLSKKQLKFNHVVTEISLQGARSTSGFDYAEAKLRMVGELPDEMKAQMDAFGQLLAPYLESTPITEFEAEAEDDESYDLNDTVSEDTEDSAF